MSEKFTKMSKTAKRVYATVASTLAAIALSIMIPMTAAADIADDYIPTPDVSLNQLLAVVIVVLLVGILFTGGIIALIIVLVTKNKKKKAAQNQVNE